MNTHEEDCDMRDLMIEAHADDCDMRKWLTSTHGDDYDMRESMIKKSMINAHAYENDNDLR